VGLTEIGIGDRLPCEFRHDIEQQPQLCTTAIRGQTFQVGKVLVIQREDGVEAGEVGRRNLPGPVAGNIYTVA